jgi:hypothetical protein
MRLVHDSLTGSRPKTPVNLSGCIVAHQLNQQQLQSIHLLPQQPVFALS